MCVYDARAPDDYRQPKWVRGVEEDDIPAALRAEGYRGETFSVTRAGLHEFDIFPEPAGQEANEIVVTFICPRSARLLRIYDLSGRVLYSLWHNGPLERTHWLPGPRLLVVGGTNCAVHWQGLSPTSAMVDPPVIFALRPELDKHGDRFMPPESDGTALSPVWYLRLCPDLERWNVSAHSIAAARGPSSAGYFDFNISFLSAGVAEEEGCAEWSIDERGQVKDGPKPGDGYQRNLLRYPSDSPLRLPDPNTLQLLPWPGCPPPPASRLSPSP